MNERRNEVNWGEVATTVLAGLIAVGVAWAQGKAARDGQSDPVERRIERARWVQKARDWRRAYREGVHDFYVRYGAAQALVAAAEALLREDDRGT